MDEDAVHSVEMMMDVDVDAVFGNSHLSCVVVYSLEASIEVLNKSPEKQVSLDEYFEECLETVSLKICYSACVVAVSSVVAVVQKEVVVEVKAVVVAAAEDQSEIESFVDSQKFAEDEGQDLVLDLKAVVEDPEVSVILEENLEEEEVVELSLSAESVASGY